MKSTIISMLVLLVLMIVVPMVLLGDNEIARKFGFGSSSGSAEKEKLKAKLPKNLKQVVTDKKVEVYKWVDEYGVMQFSNLPPSDGGKSEMMVLSPDTNVMEAVKIPKKEVEKPKEPQVFSLSSPYSPGGMKKMVDESSDLKEQLNQRQLDQEKMMQDLFPQQ